MQDTYVAGHGARSTRAGARSTRAGLRSTRAGLRPLLAIALACLFQPVAAPRAFSQLRPLDPFDGSIFERDRSGSASIGAAIYAGQRAALAGTEGRLVELGSIHLAWRLDRVALELHWTALRRFEDHESFAAPVGGVEPSAHGRRSDVGDLRLATVVRLWSREDASATLRFGTRLPTTDNGVGLDRDRTDFFALVGGETIRRPLRLSVEAGLGIHGTRVESAEQVDVMLYAVRLLYPHHRWAIRIEAVGQESWQDWSIRGNEDLHEARFGARYGERRWIDVALVRGLGPFSPHAGIAVSLGAVF